MLREIFPHPKLVTLQDAIVGAVLLSEERRACRDFCRSQNLKRRKEDLELRVEEKEILASVRSRFILRRGRERQGDRVNIPGTGGVRPDRR